MIIATSLVPDFNTPSTIFIKPLQILVLNSPFDSPNGGLASNFGQKADFIEIDWIFCLTRAQRQTPHRFYEVRERLEEFAEHYLDFWYNVDWEKNETLNDMHCLFGMICCLAELQQTLRGEIASDKPLKLVLYRRPFI